MKIFECAHYFNILKCRYDSHWSKNIGKQGTQVLCLKIPSFSKYSIIILSGYTGKNCSVNIDECAPKPCQNNGSCTDAINGYNCSCLPGFAGKNCDIDINECSSNPCMNNATCIDKVSVKEHVFWQFEFISSSLQLWLG